MALGSLRDVHGKNLGWQCDFGCSSQSENFAQLLLNLIISQNMGSFKPKFVYQSCRVLSGAQLCQLELLLEVLSFGVTVKTCRFRNLDRFDTY